MPLHKSNSAVRKQLQINFLFTETQSIFYPNLFNLFSPFLLRMEAIQPWAYHSM